ncbi:xylose isomerase [Rhizorhabdus wittichii DC-6]|uniref:Xylose isomerase domain protein TIM barrel n=2 Tax=Rhizorhabdus wittichii TaxID=160791 RepID=A0A9J9LE10_RHIWR|nr:sugar phosphate isomerase/epimerase [Rhizorhabdus wittichii]ABQ68253.1 Xylose isomerase domain protein TIM barrel [Rhizorhabdus wittichii RW1]ARR54852.1 xylose isomerase [Rhizorhabdus wittichii DC-6]QTH21318.1 sugar phosphate isomerase/epimerase [Rhizorhabdus wittichii]
MNRRELLQLSAISLAGLAAAPALARSTKPRRWGIQAGTILRVLEGDFEGTLRAVAAMGYKEIGTTGSFGRDPHYVREQLDRFGLTSPNNHVAPKETYGAFQRWVRRDLSSQGIEDVYAETFSFKNVHAAFEDGIRTSKILGQKYVMWAILLPNQIADRPTIDKHIKLFNELGDMCAREGLTFAFHNHDREFAKVGNDVILDLFLDNTDPDKVKFELDFYWATKAGADPLAYLKRYAGRTKLCHIKDITATGDFAAVGSGTLDVPALIKASDDAGIEHFLVEIDRSDDPMGAIRSSIQYLRKTIG